MAVRGKVNRLRVQCRICGLVCFEGDATARDARRISLLMDKHEAEHKNQAALLAERVFHSLWKG